MLDQSSPRNLAQPMPGLLPWQSYFLAFVLGIFAFKHTTPALVTLGVLILVDTSIRGWLHRLPVIIFLLCVAFGFGYASQRAPEPVETPAWMETRTPVAVQAIVDRVEPRQDGRLRLVFRGTGCVAWHVGLDVAQP